MIKKTLIYIHTKIHYASNIVLHSTKDRNKIEHCVASSTRTGEDGEIALIINQCLELSNL